METQDYYEFLQISPNAEPETIHRVYRFLAVRLHPDNPQTGDAEKFFLLKQAYEVLSNPQRRAEYDAARKNGDAQSPMSTTIDFMDAMEGELNRRLGILALLYFQRRTSPYTPEVSLLEVERRMGFPRDYLEFTAWYLSNKGFITRADNSDFTLTAAGVDFVETQRTSIPILDKLLAENSSAEGVSMTKALNASRVIVPPNPSIIVPEAQEDHTESQQDSKGDRSSKGKR
jgi:curved DNA-binding protein CbpA